MKRFKKIYIEITNACNLSCSFCSKTKRKIEYMSPKDFKEVLSKIKDYTDYIYLHVKGEPLLHPNLDEILSICDKEKINVQITTNGTLLKDKKDILLKHNIRQINISLHSENDIPTYFEDVFDTCNELSNKSYICYRIWTLKDNKFSKKSTNIVNKLIDYYKLSPDIVDKIYTKKDINLSKNIFLSKSNIFDWPDKDRKESTDGFCLGLNTHIGVLVDGTVIPCCLDGDGIINLGNIFTESVDEILNKELTKNIIDNFKKNKAYHPLCKKCTYKNKFK